MSHLEERLEHDLSEIREQVAAMAANVEKNLNDSFQALQTADEKLAFSTILSDHPINRAMRKIDKLCHAFIAVHLPSAGHLRLLSSVIRANIILERIGDYAVTIARESVQMDKVPEGHMALDLERISSEVMLVLREAVDGFNKLNAERAKSAIVLAEQVERNMDSIYAEILDAAENAELRNIMIIFIIFSQLKRVADQAKNLAEETIFAVTGKTKAPKIYQILFLDQDNSCLGPMAAAIAHKIFPDIGHYSSAGVTAADSLNGHMTSFLDQRGIDMSGVVPVELDTRRESLAENHVIVTLNQPVHEAIPTIPFRTSALSWEGKHIPGGDNTEEWQALYKDLALEIRELMTLLRGEENS